jgi:hypothetical protein
MPQSLRERILQAMVLIVCFDILKRYWRLSHESPVAKNHCVTAALSWIGIAFLNTLSFLQIFGPIKFINNSKSNWCILVKFLYVPLTDLKFKSANRRDPFYTSLLAWISDIHKRRDSLFPFFIGYWR